LSPTGNNQDRISDPGFGSTDHAGLLLL